jgi:hypothetical protein
MLGGAAIAGACFVVGSLLLGSTNTMAQSTIAQANVIEALHDYETGERLTRAVLERTLINVQNGISIANSSLMTKQRLPLFCPPQTLALTGPQILDMLRSGVKEDRLFGKLPVGLAIMVVLEKKFPCPKTSN